MSRISIVDHSGSTNSDLLADITRGCVGPAGHWHIARSQSAGRGRHGRQWAGHVGNFHGSTVVVADASDPPPATLALVAAVALHRALGPLMSPPLAAGLMIKWPNDLLVGTAKIGGILLERLNNVTVVGIGVNLVFAPVGAGRDTVALADVGTRIAVEDFAASLGDSFADELSRWRKDGLAATLVRWNARATPRGTALTITNGIRAGLTGSFDGLDDDGNLRLATSDGNDVIVHSGEVMLGNMAAGPAVADMVGGDRDAVGD